MQGKPTHHFFDATQARLSYFGWGDMDAPTIVMAHATGFHARVWDRTIAALPQGYRVVAVELRGHGRSPDTGPIPSWRAIALDLAELVAGLALRDVIGVGHSMGGYCMTRAAFDLPAVFRRLLLVDPVLSPPDVYRHDRYADLAGPEEHPIAHRRDSWSSWREMQAYFQHRHPYSLWRTAVLEDYCRYGLLPSVHGRGLTLACSPLVEASVYYQQPHANIIDLIRQIETPVTVLRAEKRSDAEWKTMNFVKSPTWEKLAAQFKNGRDVYLPAFSHFIPMQDPELVARFIADESAGLEPVYGSDVDNRR